MSIYDLKITRRNGEEESLAGYRGKVLIIVNTATLCGFTPQYKGLERLYQKYHNNGLEILDFPCDQFEHQSPGSDDEIHHFCQQTYHTTFDQYRKVEVNGPGASPLFAYLKGKLAEDEINGERNKMIMMAILSATVVTPTGGRVLKKIQKEEEKEKENEKEKEEKEEEKEKEEENGEGQGKESKEDKEKEDKEKDKENKDNEDKENENKDKEKDNGGAGINEPSKVWKSGDIKWNFTKFVVDKEGRVVKRYSPVMKPDEMEEAIRILLS